MLFYFVNVHFRSLIGLSMALCVAGFRRSPILGGLGKLLENIGYEVAILHEDI